MPLCFLLMLSEMTGGGQPPSSNMLLYNSAVDASPLSQLKAAADQGFREPISVLFACLLAEWNKLNPLRFFWCLVLVAQFQKAKLKFEDKLVEAGRAGEIGYSIVRPTAFFKSVSGQLEVCVLVRGMRRHGPLIQYVMFFSFRHAYTRHLLCQAALVMVGRAALASQFNWRMAQGWGLRLQTRIVSFSLLGWTLRESESFVSLGNMDQGMARLKRGIDMGVVLCAHAW